jgi:hypothetical protein
MSSHRPTLAQIVRRVALSLLVACAIPAAIIALVTTYVGVWWAIGAALVWAYAAIGVRHVTGRRPSGLLLLTAAILTGRTIISFAAGSTFFYFLQPMISDLVVGAVFLLSLTTARPLVARLAGDFYPMDGELACRPRILRLFWWLTMVWGLLAVARAATTLWLLTSQSLDTFVIVNGVSMLGVNVIAAGLTIAAAGLVGRKEGLVGPARIVASAAR